MYLSFDTRLLVKCYDDPQLSEWYTLDRNSEIIVQDIMEWKPQTGLVVTTSKNLYERRNDVAGTLLKVSTVRQHPKLINNKPDGVHHAMFTKTLVEIAFHTNFNVHFLPTNTYYGSYDRREKRWMGILGRLENEEIDIAATEMTMTKSRLNDFDFAGPLILSRVMLYIREPGSSVVQWNAYLKAFNRNIWVSLIVLIILSAILLTYMKIKINKKYSLKNYLVENHLSIWGIYCQQGLSEFPDSSSLRIAYVSIFFSAVILSAIYSASIISYLTIFSPTLPFNTLPKFVEAGTHKLVVLRNSAEQQMFTMSKGSVIRQMNKLMKREKELPVDDVEAFEMVCREKVAYYSNEAMRRKVDNNIPCKVIGIKTDRVDNLAFALTKDNPFTSFINYYILKFQDNGVMQRMRTMYYKRFTEPRKDYNSVEISGIAPLMTILVFGMALSVLILFIEKLYYRVTLLDIDRMNCVILSRNSKDISRWRKRRHYPRNLQNCCYF